MSRLTPMRLGAVAALVGAALSFVVAPQAQASAGDPIGHLDSVAIGTAGGGERPEENDTRLVYFAHGWAADPDVGNGPVALHLYVDGRNVGQTSTGHPRGDVERAHPWAGPNTGFVGQVEFAADSAHHRICVYAINQGAGSNNTTLGCRTVGPTARDGYEPLAHFDGFDFAGPGKINIRGWAGEREVVREPGNPDPQYRVPTPLKLYIDGRPLGVIAAQAMRDDVQRAHPELDLFTGINMTVPVPQGWHQICIYALNLGTRGMQNTTMGCFVFDTPGRPPPSSGWPDGSVDGIDKEVASGGSGVSSFLVGWAHDPQSRPDTNILVRGFTYSDFGRWRHINQEFFPTDQRRTDVAAYNPDYGFETGFRANLGSGTHHHRVIFACAYTTREDQFIGCMADPP